MGWYRFFIIGLIGRKEIFFRIGQDTRPEFPEPITDQKAKFTPKIYFQTNIICNILDDFLSLPLTSINLTSPAFQCEELTIQSKGCKFCFVLFLMFFVVLVIRIFPFLGSPPVQTKSCANL